MNARYRTYLLLGLLSSVLVLEGALTASAQAPAADVDAETKAPQRRLPFFRRDCQRRDDGRLFQRIDLRFIIGNRRAEQINGLAMS